MSLHKVESMDSNSLDESLDKALKMATATICTLYSCNSSSVYLKPDDLDDLKDSIQIIKDVCKIKYFKSNNINQSRVSNVISNKKQSPELI